MTPAVCKAVTKLITGRLFREFNSALSLGPICHRHQIDDDPARPGELIPLGAEMAPATVTSTGFDSHLPATDFSQVSEAELRHEFVEVFVPGVVDALMNPATLMDQIDALARQLAEKVDTEILRGIDGFSHCLGDRRTGITAQLLAEADSRLFDLVPENNSSLNLVLDAAGVDQFHQQCKESVGLFDICRVDRELSAWAMIPKDVVQLTMKRIQFTGADFLNANFIQEPETNTCFTLVFRDGGDPQSLYVQIHALFATGVTKPEAGIRLCPTAIQSRQVKATIGQTGMSHQISVPVQSTTVSNSAVSTESIHNGLATAISDPTISRLLIVTSTLDVIEDPRTRLSAAIRLLENADGIGIGDLILAGQSQLDKLHTVEAEFNQVMESRKESEIDAREQRILQLETEILIIERRLEDLRREVQSTTTEITDRQSAILDDNWKFASDVSGIADTINRLLADLRDHLPAIATSTKAQN